jgi:hypothetical protein
MSSTHLSQDGGSCDPRYCRPCRGPTRPRHRRYGRHYDAEGNRGKGISPLLTVYPHHTRVVDFIRIPDFDRNPASDLANSTLYGASPRVFVLRKSLWQILMNANALRLSGCLRAGGRSWAQSRASILFVAARRGPIRTRRPYRPPIIWHRDGSVCIVIAAFRDS